MVLFQVERLNRSLKDKIRHDLVERGSVAVNWLEELPVYEQLLNGLPHQSFGLIEPFVYVRALSDFF